jgi:hypothetical protein
MKPVHTNNRLPDIGDGGHSGGEDQLTGSDNFLASQCGPAVSFRRRSQGTASQTKAISAAHVDEEDEANPNHAKRWDILR